MKSLQRRRERYLGPYAIQSRDTYLELEPSLSLAQLQLGYPDLLACNTISGYLDTNIQSLSRDSYPEIGYLTRIQSKSNQGTQLKLVWCLVCCVIEPGPKTKALRILIPFGGGRCWCKEYQKNSRKFKICIIMHKICILCIFLKMPKNHFSGHFR